MTACRFNASRDNLKTNSKSASVLSAMRTLTMALVVGLLIATASPAAASCQYWQPAEKKQRAEHAIAHMNGATR